MLLPLTRMVIENLKSLDYSYIMFPVDLPKKRSAETTIVLIPLNDRQFGALLFKDEKKIMRIDSSVIDKLVKSGDSSYFIDDSQIEQGPF